jgi:hypothetical protein
MWAQFIYHPFIIAPVLFLALAFLPAKSKFNTIFNILIVGLYTFIIYKVVPWPDYGSYYLRYFYLLLFLTSCLKPIARFKGLPFFSGKIQWKWAIKIFGFIKILVLLFLIWIFVKVVTTSSIKNIKTIELSFPLKSGEYYIHQGGINSVTNYHRSFWDKYAYDIDKINRCGKTWSNEVFPPDNIVLYDIFKDTVYSPCAGKVVEVVKHFKDHGTGELNDFKDDGNKIVIQKGEYQVTLLHLSHNSTLVIEGDSIFEGQPLGLVGNSGRSKKPHLHIHAYHPDSNNPYEANVLILFNGELFVRNDMLKSLLHYYTNE